MKMQLNKKVVKQLSKTSETLPNEVTPEIAGGKVQRPTCSLKSTRTLP